MTTQEKLAAALEPFANYADPHNRIPANMPITQGSGMAKRQLTMGDCYAARDALSEAARVELTAQGQELAMGNKPPASEIEAAPGYHRRAPARGAPVAVKPRPYPYATGDGMQYSETLVFEGGSMTIHSSGHTGKEGNGYFCFGEHECEAEYEGDKTYWVAYTSNSELIAIRDKLNEIFPAHPATAQRRGISRCNKCGEEYPSAPLGYLHKCGRCSGVCLPIDLDQQREEEERIAEMRSALESALDAIGANTLPIVRRAARIKIKAALSPRPEGEEE